MSRARASRQDAVPARSARPRRPGRRPLPAAQASASVGGQRRAVAAGVPGSDPHSCVGAVAFGGHGSGACRRLLVDAVRVDLDVALDNRMSASARRSHEPRAETCSRHRRDRCDVAIRRGHVEDGTGIRATAASNGSSSRTAAPSASVWASYSPRTTPSWRATTWTSAPSTGSSVTDIDEPNGQRRLVDEVRRVHDDLGLGSSAASAAPGREEDAGEDDRRAARGDGTDGVPRALSPSSTEGPASIAAAAAGCPLGQTPH